jgi:CheY-like chemotaxis protein
MSKNSEKPVMFSALEVANLCGVVNQTAINWIRGGYLKAFKTPGGQYRVYPDDLATFMNDRNMHIPEKLLNVCNDAESYKTKSILIVDDDKGLNSVIAQYLATKFDGIEIVQAFNGFEAGHLMSENHPKCLILDLDLPGIDGFEICRQINEGSPYGNPAVIIITALQDADAEARCRNYGVMHFFRKPLKMEELSDAVRKIL